MKRQATFCTLIPLPPERLGGFKLVLCWLLGHQWEYIKDQKYRCLRCSLEKTTLTFSEQLKKTYNDHYKDVLNNSFTTEDNNDKV